MIAVAGMQKEIAEFELLGQALFNALKTDAVDQREYGWNQEQRLAVIYLFGITTEAIGELLATLHYCPASDWRTMETLIFRQK